MTPAAWNYSSRFETYKVSHLPFSNFKNSPQRVSASDNVKLYTPQNRAKTAAFYSRLTKMRHQNSYIADFKEKIGMKSQQKVPFLHPGTIKDL